MTSSVEPEYRHRCVGFRKWIANKAERALEAIGFDGDVDALLIGIQGHGDSGTVCWTEPEVDPAHIEALQDAVRKVDLIHDSQSGRGILGGDSYFRAARDREIRDEERSQAIADALAATSAGQDRTFLTGSKSIQVDGADIYMVVDVDSSALQTVPILATVRRRRIPFIPSFAHAVIHEVFARLRPLFHSRDLIFESDTNELVRVAASRFVRYVFLLAGHGAGSTHDTLNVISALPYEGRAGSGKIIIGSVENEHVSVAIRLHDTIPFGNAESVRKLLEASGPEGYLLSDGEYVYGIGNISASYPADSESIFTVDIVERGKWELRHLGTPLLAVHDGAPRLPSGPFDVEYFREIVERLLPGASIPSLVNLAEAAGANKHGAMLIISSDAAGEAKRLHPQASRVTPTAVSPGVLTQLTAMDGGIIIDSQGLCYAVGVILDGTACGGESSARGSRFNNAIRYVQSVAPDAVVVVYSTDGKIDILPKLPYRIKKSLVDSAVEGYLALATPPSDADGLEKSWEAVKRLKFYLSDEQCVRINQARKSIEGWRRDRGLPYPVEDEFDRSNAMDDTYWLPEE